LLLRAIFKILKKYGIYPIFKINFSPLTRLLLFLYNAYKRAYLTIKNKAAVFFTSILPTKWGPILKRYSDERTHIINERSRISNRLRKLKWRSLSTNRERVRYYYIAFLKKQIRAGATIYTSDTPNEIYNKLRKENSNLDNTLFSLYNLARYKDEKGSITEEDVELIKRKK